MLNMVRIEQRRRSLGVFSFNIGPLKPLLQTAGCATVSTSKLAPTSMDRRVSVDIAVNTSNTAIPTHQCRRHAKGKEMSLDDPSSTFYMGVRSLDSTSSYDSLIPYRSDEGIKLLVDCLNSGSNENYISLSEQFLTQSSPPSCGVATLAMVLNSLRIDPGRVWRKPWRWFTEETLISCFPLDKTEQELGLTMEHFGLIAECNGATAQTFYGSSISLDDFRTCLEAVFFSASWERRLVVAFDRLVLGQTGTGHYSPIGAYHREADMVLVLDVARFKYPPYWVPVAEMWEAMRTVDPESHRSRGFFIMSRSPTNIRDLDGLVEAKIDSPILSHVINAVLDHRSNTLKSIAAELVHDVRKRILSCTCLGKSCDTLVDCSSYKYGKELVNTLRNEGSLRDVLNIDKILQVGLKDESEMRPIDFFIQSMPQFVHELVTLMIIEQGTQFMEPEALNRLLHRENIV